MTLTELLARKAKAEALPPETIAQHIVSYTDVCDQVHGKLIDLAMACDAYTQVFIHDPDDMGALIEAARKLQSEVSA